MRTSYTAPAAGPFDYRRNNFFRPSLSRFAGAASLCAIALFLAFAPLHWATVGTFAVACGLFLLRFPWLFWIALAAVLPWTSGIRIGPGSVTDALLALGLFLWFADSVRRGSFRFHTSSPGIAALIYVAVLYLVAFQAVDIQAAAVQLIKWLQFALVLFIVPTAVRPGAQVPWLVCALFIGAATQAAWGLIQYRFNIGPDWFMFQGQFMRASGSFGQPNPFGAYMGLTLPVALSVLSWLSMRPLRKRRLHWRDLAGWTLARGLVILLAAALLVSWSRGAWLGALAGALVVFWLSSTRIVRMSAIVAVVAALAFGAAAPLLQLAPPEVLARAEEIPRQFGIGLSLQDSIDAEITDDNFAILERLAFWLAAVRMWDSAPWLGVGPGNFDAVYAVFGVPRWEQSLGHAHNLYLNALAETGIVGAAAFLGLWVVNAVYAYRSYRQSRKTHRWQAALSVGVLGVIAHLAVHGLFDNLFVQGMFLHLSLWIAILISLQGSERDPATSA